MKAFRAFVRRLPTLSRSQKHDREIDDEIASHLEEATDEHMARGLSRADARLAALRDFGGLTQTKQVYREVRSFTWPEDLRQDLTYSVRRLVTPPPEPDRLVAV